MKRYLCLAAFLLASCADRGVPVPGHEDAVKNTAAQRAERRAFDGAPPIIPHENFGVVCGECHDAEGMSVADVGFAPPSPHSATAGLSEISRCQQCHIFKQTDEVLLGNDFVGLRQDLRRGERSNPLSPPVMPHRALMRENCLACHSGPAAREGIRTTHPERIRCRQCHLEQTTNEIFAAFGEPR